MTRTRPTAKKAKKATPGERIVLASNKRLKAYCQCTDEEMLLWLRTEAAWENRRNEARSIDSAIRRAVREGFKTGVQVMRIGVHEDAGVLQGQLEHKYGVTIQ